MTLHRDTRPLPLAGGGTLQLTRFRPEHGATRAPVLLWHGALASGRAFYSDAGKGLAPWLAKRGHDVAVIDQRGRGRATPVPARGMPFDQTDVIVEEIPAALAAWRELSGAERTHLVAHSWGGVLFAAHLARFPESRAGVISQVYLGTKRRVGVHNRQRWLYVDLVWCLAGSALRRIHGYLPARRWGWGAEDEYAGTHRQGADWVRRRNWIDPRDGFDYARALADGGLPATLHLAGAADRALGHPEDVRRFRDECGPHENDFRLLGRAAGLSRDYGHDDMLLHPRARDEVYPQVATWLRHHEERA